MTRSADDETLRVPAGCPKHPVHRSCLRRTPGRDPTLERRSPEVKSGGAFRSNLASRSPLGERSARAFRLAIPWHDPATCGAAAMPRNHYAMATRMSASKRSATRHLAFCGSEDRCFRSGWLPRVPFPSSEPRATWLPRRHPSRRRGGSSPTASVFLHHPRAPPCFTAQPSRSPHRPWQVRSELVLASGSEGFSLFADRRAPDRLLPLGSLLASGDRRVVAEHPVVAPAWLAVRKIP